MVEGWVVAGVVEVGIVDVCRHDVEVFLTRVPIVVVVACVPHPNHIVDSLHVYHFVIHKSVELLERFCSFASPPEPATACLVERSEDASHASTLHVEEIVSNGVDVLDDVFIERRGSVPAAIALEGIADFHVGARSVELVAASTRVAPMPCEGREATLAVRVFGKLHTADGVILVPCVRGFLARGIHEVETDKCRIFARSGIHRPHVGMLLDIAVCG